MSLLLRSALIVDPSSPYHGEIKNVLISNGKIDSISDAVPDADEVVHSEKMILTPGWMDFRAFLGEPGFEHIETLESGTNAAAAGGFTALGSMPNTQPVIQNKETIRALKSNNEQRVTSLYPIGALTKDTEGKELTEILDLTTVGTKVFGDGYKTIANPTVLVKALQYNQLADNLTIDFPLDEKLAEGCQVHESKYSTINGLKSTPSFHETIRINRDIEILRYTGGRLHLSNISTKEGIALIREAKKEGLQLSSDVAVSHLAFNESKLAYFDTNAKVSPPLRSIEDQDALWQAIEDGTIDVIASNHLPLDEECKKLEFDLADFGMNTLETVLPMLLQAQKKFSWDSLYSTLVENPRKLAGILVPSIKEGEQANLTAFDPTKKWKYNASTSFSLSKNSPLYGQEVQGKVLATVKDKNKYIADV